MSKLTMNKNLNTKTNNTNSLSAISKELNLKLTSLDWEDILLKIQDFATSGCAKIKISELHTCPNQEVAHQQMQNIFYAQELVQTGVRPFMESLDLFESWHSRLRKQAVLKTIEIKDVRHFCLETLALYEALNTIEQQSGSENKWCHKLFQSLMDSEEPLSAIDQLITPHGEIRSDASEKLFQLFREKENLTRQIEKTLDKTVNDHQMVNLLQDKYVTTREGRWVLPIKSGMQHYMPGVIHSSSQTKQTVFMEPESIIPMNNRLRQVELDVEIEIERLLTELSEYLSSLQTDFSATRDKLEEADICIAKAQWSLRIQAQPFTFSVDRFVLNEVRHPLLVFSQNEQRPVVANTVELNDKKSILLLSGPNAGGKTVLLKSIGLAAQMARCGLPICASDSSELPFFSHIQIGIGDSQSVGAELSTFAAHLKILQASVQLKGLNNLILIDEICGSTDPEEGSALARAFIERFSSNQVFSIITSHLGPLKTGWTDQDHVLNGSLEYDNTSGKPTYQFLQGIPGDSLAIQTAKRVGVDNDIVQRSTELLSPETRKRLSAIEELDRLKHDLSLLQEHLRKEQQRAKFEKEKYEALSKKFQKEKDDLLAKSIKQAEKKIEELVQQAKVEQTFKKHTALQEIKTNLPEIVKSKPGSGTSGNIESAKDFAGRYPPGARVYIPSLKQDGLIQSLPNGKGEVMILSGSLRMMLPWQDIKPPEKAQNPTADLVRRAQMHQRSNNRTTVAISDEEKVVDLRGQTVEEALSKLEMQLDQSASMKDDRIKVIHGHGTEALKKAVRTYLSRSVYVKKWKAGSPEQGGDGITWVELSDEN